MTGTPIEIIIYTSIFLGLYFAILTLVTLFENRKNLYKKEGNDYPNICLIVPAYNEEKTIGKTLNSFLKLAYPKDELEVIVVDDGSQDRTFKIVDDFREKNKKLNLKVFRKRNGGKYTALNLGIQNTKAELIGTVDADSYLDSKAIKKITAYFKDPEIKAAISTIRMDSNKGILSAVQNAEFLIGSAFIKKAFSFLGGINVVPGPLSVFRKEVFKEVGLYRDGYKTEDLEMAFRLQKRNFKIAHAVDAIVYTTPCITFKSLFRQRLRWRRGVLLNLKDYPELLNPFKHGHLALLLLYGLFGFSATLFISSYAIFKIINSAWGKFNHLWLVNFDFSQLLANISFSLPNIKPILFLGFFSLLAFISYILIGKRISFEKRSVKKDSFCFIILYNFLSALWWVSAVYAALFKKDINW